MASRLINIALWLLVFLLPVKFGGLVLLPDRPANFAEWCFSRWPLELAVVFVFVWAAAAIGAVIGFYDGFFGPGTGSFLVFLFVRLLGYDFLNASASAKLINTATNSAALILFAFKGHVWWHFVLAMALSNVLGSVLGTRLALKHGTGFVRAVFILVVVALIIKTGYDAFLR